MPAPTGGRNQYCIVGEQNLPLICRWMEPFEQVSFKRNRESLNASTISTYAHFAPPLCRTCSAVPGAAPSAPQLSGPWLTSAEGGDRSLCCIAATAFVRLRDDTVAERLVRNCTQPSCVAETAQLSPSHWLLESLQHVFSSWTSCVNSKEQD